MQMTIADFDPKKIEESGQCFRMWQPEENVWQLIAFGHCLRIESLGAHTYSFSCNVKEFEEIWKDYFDLDRDYGAIRAKVPKDDAFLNAAIAYGGGIRILRQEPFEMLITFIISQRKNIPAIRKAVETLSESFGEKICVDDKVYYAFPTAERLALCSESDLADCALGYRTKYVMAAARAVAAGDIALEEMGNFPDEALKEALLKVYGVGTKVADCVLLFGYHRLSAFPRDVWINRILHDVYADDFSVERYEGVGGVIQQYMFFFARSEEYKAFCGASLEV